MWVVECFKHGEDTNRIIYGPFAEGSDAALFAKEQERIFDYVFVHALTSPAVYATGGVDVDIDQFVIDDYIDPSIIP